jgi:glycosyltransferase involved in cell wall biosynthesis
VSADAHAPVPRVSVVMPAHNMERYIGAAVRSVLDGDARDVEVIVVDDGSTDGTIGTVNAIGDPRVTVIAIAASGGPAKPRNIGISRARAPYISLFDSDDLLKPGKLAACAAALDRNPSAGFAFGDYESIDVDGRMLDSSAAQQYPVFRGLQWHPAGADWRLITQTELARGLLYENFIGTSGVVARKKLVVSLGGLDESLPNGDDLDLWFRLAHQGDALYCPSVGHSYRVRPASVVRGPPLRNAYSRIKVLRREKERWREPTARRQISRRIAENLGVIGYQQRLQRRRQAAVATYLQAFRVSPHPRWLRGILGALLS